jgi:membrane protein implicated in regulation of membrane protease activity
MPAQDQIAQLTRIFEELQDIAETNNLLGMMTGFNLVALIIEAIVFIVGLIPPLEFLLVIDLIVILIHIITKILEHSVSEKTRARAERIRRELEVKQLELTHSVLPG